MSKKAKNVFQFKIALEGIKPAIWRQIQVPETYSFWDLHVAIQDSMGWLDYHLHQFKILNPQTENEELIGIPSGEISLITNKTKENQFGFALILKHFQVASFFR